MTPFRALATFHQRPVGGGKNEPTVGTVVTIDADNTFRINNVPTLLLQGSNMTYHTWYFSGYTEAQADVMIQQALAAGVNVCGGTDIYPYSDPAYVGKMSIEVFNMKFGRSWCNAPAGKPNADEATNIRAILASPAFPYHIVWNYFSEPDMSLYATVVPFYQLIGQLDPAVPINCTEAIRDFPTHSYSGFFNTGGDGGYWDEVVHAHGLQIPIVEFSQDGNALKLWEYLYMMNRRVRGLAKAAPTSTPTAAAGGAGVLTGTYRFVYTWVYGTGYTDPEGVESFASPISVPITVSGQQVVVSGLTGPVGTGKINLWGHKDGVSKEDGSWPTSGYSCIATGLPSTTTSYTVTTDLAAWIQGTIPPRVSQLGWIPSISTTLAGELFGWNAIANTIPTTGTLSTGSAVVTGIPDTTLMGAQMGVSGIGIPTGTQVASVGGPTQITLSQAATVSGSQVITVQGRPTFDQVSRWWWLQVAMNCRAFEWYFADFLRGPGGNNDPAIGPLSQNTKIALVSSDPSDTRVCSLEGLLSDQVTVAREDALTLNGVTSIQTSNTYSLVKWVACHTQVAPFTTSGTVALGSAVVTGIPSTSTLKANMTIAGANIPSDAQILSVDSGTQITMTRTASGSASGETLTVGHTITFTEVATGNNIAIHIPGVDPGKYAALVLPAGNYKGVGLALFAPANDGLPNGYLQQWNDTAIIVGRVKSLESVIVAPGQWQRISAVTPTFVPFDDSLSNHNPKGIYAAKKPVQGILYVIAVNWQQSNTTGNDQPLTGATIDVGQSITSVTRIAGESGAPSFTGSVITDDFLASQVHVYSVQ